MSDARQIRPRTADDPLAAAETQTAALAAATARPGLFREVLEDVARPAVVAMSGLIAAAVELEDDAALGRRARELVRAHATGLVDRALRQDRSARNAQP